MSRSGSGLANTEGSTNSLRWAGMREKCDLWRHKFICRSGSSLEPDSGPDRVLPAESFTSCSPAAPVKLWMPGDHEDCDDEDLRWADKLRIEYLLQYY